MKQLIVMLLICIAFLGITQQCHAQISYNISAYQIKDTAVRMDIRILNFTPSSVTIYYALLSRTGKIIEQGNKEFPVSSLAIISSADGTDIAALNELLSAGGWPINVLSQIDESQPPGN